MTTATVRVPAESNKDKENLDNTTRHDKDASSVKQEVSTTQPRRASYSIEELQERVERAKALLSQK